MYITVYKVLGYWVHLFTINGITRLFLIRNIVLIRELYINVYQFYKQESMVLSLDCEKKFNFVPL